MGRRRFVGPAESDRLVELGCLVSKRAQADTCEMRTRRAETRLNEVSPDLSAAVSRVHIEVSDPPDSSIIDEWIDVQATHTHDATLHRCDVKGLAGPVEPVRAISPLIDGPLHQSVSLMETGTEQGCQVGRCLARVTGDRRIIHRSDGTRTSGSGVVGRPGPGRLRHGHPWSFADGHSTGEAVAWQPSCRAEAREPRYSRAW